MEHKEIIDINELHQDNHNFNKGTQEGMKLIKKSFSELGAGRSILIDKDNNIIAGNKSQLAAIASGIQKVRVIETDGTELIAVKRMDVELDSKEGRALALADNKVAEVNLSWDEVQLEQIETRIDEFDKLDWGFDINDIPSDPVVKEDESLREEAIKRASWRNKKDYKDPLCDLKVCLQLHSRNGRLFVSSYKRSENGIPISDIKTADNVKLFAMQAESICRGMIGFKQKEGWCIVTTPKRRHKEKNFSSMVCDELSKLLGIPFYEDVVEAKNKHRINPEFKLIKNISENGVILYDDIITTGSTLKATADLFADKNVLCVIGINNN